MSSYNDKIKLLVELTKNLYNNLPISRNLIYIDGGELTGTTSLINGLKNFDTFEECIYTKEPSPESKKKILDTFGENSLIDDPSKIIKAITDMFMEDRKENQSKIVKDKLLISDRGIFSTIVYQSGILDPSSSIEDVKRNCDVIFESAKTLKIFMPSLAFNLCTIDGNGQADIETFKYRLNKRMVGNEQALDSLDNISSAMVINKVYSDIAIGFGDNTNGMFYRLYNINFRLSTPEILKFVVETIQGIYEKSPLKD